MLKPNRPYWLLVIIFLLLGSFLRIYALGEKSMWFDEVLSVQISVKNIDQIWQELTKITNQPPLYLWLLHFFLKIGVSEFWARLPSAIFGILALLLVYHVGRKLFNKWTAFFTLCLFALSPLHLYYSQEARMYSLWIFLITLSYFFLYKLCKGNTSAFLWAGYFLSLLLSIYTHYFAAFHIVTQGVIVGVDFVFSQEKKSIRWVYFLILGGMIALFSIPVMQLATQGSSHGSGLSFQDWTPLLVLEEIIRGWLVFLVLGGGNSYTLGYHYALAFFLFLLFYIGLYFTLRSNARLALFLLAWLIVPLYLGTFFLEQVASYHERYFLPITVPYLLFAGRGLQATASGLARLVRKGLRWIKTSSNFAWTCVFLSILLIFLFFDPIINYYQIEKQDNKSAVKYVTARNLPGDSIVLDGFGEVAMAYYFQDYRLSIVKPRTAEAIDFLGKSCRRVWYLYGWESSGVWLKPDLYPWSQKVGVQPQVIPGAFPIYIVLVGPDVKEVNRILEVTRDKFVQNPGDYRNGLEYGNCLLTLGHWKEAVSVYAMVASGLRDEIEGGNQDVQIQDQLTQVLLGIGDAQARQQHWKEAALAYREAIAIDPANVTDREDIVSIETGIN